MTNSLQLPRPRTSNWALALALSAGVTLSGCGGGSDCGGPFCMGFDQPRAARLVLGSGSGQTGATGRELPDSIEVLVTDDEQQPVQDALVTFSVAPAAGSLAETEVRSDVNGRAWTTWTLGPEPGTQTAQAAASSSGAPLNGSPVTFSAEAVRPPPAKLVLRQAPSVSARNGITLEQQPIVEVLDSDDQPVPQVQVSVAIASGGGMLTGTTSVVSDAQGRAAYSDLALAGPSGTRTFRFSVAEPALEVVSGAIIVGAGGPAQITGNPPLTYQGTVSSPVDPAPSVAVKDAANNPVPGITVSFTADGGASVSPGTATTDDRGVARVTNWTLGTTANVQYTLTARVEGSSLTPVRFTAMARAGAAGRLSIATQPSATAQNGSPFAQQPAIQVVDRDGNPAPQGDVQITASIAAGPTGTLQNATATTNAQGLATFSGLTLTGAAGNYTVSFSAAGLGGVMSNPIALSAGPAAQLAFAVAPPAITRSRVPLAPVVELQDASGNSVAQGGIPIVASVDVGAPIGATSVNTGIDGRAAFTDLAIASSPGLKTLIFNSSGLQPLSVQVTLRDVVGIAANPATPAFATVNTTLNAVPIGILKDITGQPVADAPFTLAPAAGTVAVSPPSGISGPDGVVTADSWTLGTATGDQGVMISVPGPVPSLLVKIQGTAAAADTLRMIMGDGQSAPPNSKLQAFVVRLADKYGNGVPNVEVQWRACDGSVEQKTPTDGNGSTSIVVTTGTQAGPACVRAGYPGVDGPQVNGSPVTFNYMVTGSVSMSQSTGFRAPVFTPQKTAPDSPRPRGVRQRN